MDIIENKVAASGLITIDLETLLPNEDTLALFDIKPFLYKEMILREKDFREALKQIDATPYTGKHVAITCTADAIIPMWAYMLIAVALQPFASSIFYGDKVALSTHLLLQEINALNTDFYKGARVIIKGCGDTPLPQSAYVAITHRLLPVVKSLMYGEACSNVPIYKLKNQ